MSTDNTNLEEMVEKTLESTGVLPKMRVSHIKIMMKYQLLST